MTTNFSAQATAASELQSNAAPDEGVVTDRETVTPDASGIFDAASKMVKGIRTDRNEKIVSDFMLRQTAVADALDQGSIKNKSVAQARLRKNFMEALQANPNLRSEFAAAQREVVGTTGIGAILSAGTESEQLYNMQRDALLRANLINHDAGREEVEEALTAEQMRQSSLHNYQTTMNTISLERAKIGLDADKQDSLDDRAAAAQNELVKSNFSGEFQSMRQQMAQIVQDTEISSADKETMLKNIQNDYLGRSAAVLGSQESGFRTLATDALDRLTQTYIGVANGSVEADALENQINTIDRGMELLFRQESPLLARAAVMSKALGPEAFANLLVRNPALTTELVTVFGSFAGEGDKVSTWADTPKRKQAIAATLPALVDEAMGDDPETADNAQRAIKELLKTSENRIGELIDNPTAARTLVKWMGSASFQQARSQMPELFENIEGLTTGLKIHYQDQVLDMAEREFKNRQVLLTRAEGGDVKGRGDTAMTDVTALVEAMPSDKGVTFQAIDPNNPRAVAEAAQLNKKLGVIINESVRAAAHLNNGSTNYRQTWEELSSQIGMAPVEEGLNLSDFKVGESQLDQALTTGGFVGSGDYSEAETPAEVAAAFTGFTETEHEDVLSSFIAKTAGQKLSPAKTAWCAAFVNGALGATGQEGTGTLLARDFLNWGEEVKSPTKGDVVVFSRGNSSWQGHVGFYVGENEDGDIQVLGGNQSNKVSIQTYSRDDLLGFRRGKI